MVRSAWLSALLLLSALPAVAQLPDPPSEDALHDLIGRLNTESAGHSSPATRDRLAAQVAAVTGSAARLQNGAGLMLTLRGYPWEGLWFLTRSAQVDLEQPDTLSNMGLLLVLIERHDDAERILLYATHRWSGFAPAWTNLARLYCDRRDYRRAQFCLDQGNTAQPGSITREEIALRMAAEQRDADAAASHAVNLANLAPQSSMLRRVARTIPGPALARALEARAAAVPMPETFVQLDAPIDRYEDFVLDELNRGYWQAAFMRFGEISGTPGAQTIPQLPQDVFDRLPPNIQATLRAQGAGPGQPLAVLSPTESRTHYMVLHMHLQRYTRRFQTRLGPTYRDGEVERLITEQRERCKHFNDEYAAALKAGGDPVGAANRYCRDVLNSLNAAHPSFLQALAQARAAANRLTSRHWATTAGLITMVPTAYQADEISFLRRQAAMNSLYYTGCVMRWSTIGRRAVVLDRVLAEASTAALHAAAAARMRESIMAAEDRRARLEEAMETGEDADFPLEMWIGLDLGVFALKCINGEEIEVSGGEYLVGEVSYNWHDEEFEIGVGLGGALPPIGPFGGNEKVLGVMRVGGDERFALGFHGAAQLSMGTPIAGADYNVADQYSWLTSAGNPDNSMLGAPW